MKIIVTQRRSNVLHFITIVEVLLACCNNKIRIIGTLGTFTILNKKKLDKVNVIVEFFILHNRTLSEDTVYSLGCFTSVS